MKNKKEVLVFGATGNMGGAVARELLGRGWSVRAVTRHPDSRKALALAAIGSEICQADMDDPGSLSDAFDGMTRVFSVQNWSSAGVEGEIRQGKLVAEAARNAAVEHLVYGSAGTGEPDTGIPHFQAKLAVEAHMRALSIPFTVLRPGPFMELLTDKAFFPSVGAWGTEPRVVGWQTPTPWVAVRDIGIAVANIFEEPERWLGTDVTLIGDVKSLADCRQVFVDVDGKKPFRIPLPLGIFRRMAGDEFILMWRWLVDYVAEHGVDHYWKMARASRELCPEILDLEGWLKLKRGFAGAEPEGQAGRAYEEGETREVVLRG